MLQLVLCDLISTMIENHEACASRSLIYCSNKICHVVYPFYPPLQGSIFWLTRNTQGSAALALGYYLFGLSGLKNPLIALRFPRGSDSEFRV